MSREGTEEIWDSVLVSCGEAEGGSLEVEIRFFHPDWDEGRQIALIKSRPNHKGAGVLMLTFEFGQACRDIV